EQNWDRVHHLYQEMAHESLRSEAVLHEGAQKILRENPHHKPSLMTAMRHSLNANDTSAGLEYLRRYHEAGGEKTPELTHLEFESLEKLGLKEQAIEIGNKLLSENPDDTRLLQRLAD